MDWQFAIDKNREALAIVVAGLIAMARQPGSRPHHRAILRILRPAEAALRRLIVVVAAMLVRKAREGRGADRAVENSTPLPDFFAFNRRDHMPSFPLIDPRKRFGQVARANGLGTPRISLPGVFDVANPACGRPNAEWRAPLAPHPPAAIRARHTAEAGPPPQPADGETGKGSTRFRPHRPDPPRSSAGPQTKAR